MSEEKKFLEPGKTEIGKVLGTYNGQAMNMTIFYGNSVFPTVKKNGKEEFVHLKEDKYLQMLNDFFKTEEGKKYKRPSKDIIDKDRAYVLAQEKEYMKKLGQSSDEKEPPKEVQAAPEKPELKKGKEKKAEPKPALENIDDYATVLLTEDVPAKKCPTLTNMSTGEVISLSKTVFKIGCSTGSDLVIEQDAKSHTISRQHATIITKNDDSLYITDKSSNGTFISEKKDGEFYKLPKDHEVELKDNTYIKFATEVFLYKEV